MQTAPILYENSRLLGSLCLSVVLGFAVGLEREVTNKSAGLRTNIMVCAGSCLFTILSMYGFTDLAIITTTRDPARVAAQILTGIGFIGGGTVLRHGTSVYGLTTAATLWMCASIGMACGCGKYFLAIITALITVFVLTLVRLFEKICIPKRKNTYREFSVSVFCNKNDFDDLILQFTADFPQINELNKKVCDDNENINFTCKISVCGNNPLEFISKKLKNKNKIKSLCVKELNL